MISSVNIVIVIIITIIIIIIITIANRGERLRNSDKGANLDVEEGLNPAQSFVLCLFIMLD